MWGTDQHLAAIAANYRFIPTHVGNGPASRCHCGQLSVHPHACGERLAGQRRGGGAGGSSPRMWGTVRQGCSHCLAFRFIPTHVGNGSPARHCHRCNAVHPHACGERKLPHTRSINAVGSSPRMWGTDAICDPDGNMLRFIPTHVGNGVLAWPQPYPASVHPHACGERVGSGVDHAERDGSSPRMWGTGHRHRRRRPG